MVQPHQQQPEEFFVTGDPSVVFHKGFYQIQINPRTDFISTIEHLSEGTKDAPWGWQCNTETCSSYHTQLINWMNNLCICWFFTYINEMHGSRSKIPSKNLVRQRWANGFNSGFKGLRWVRTCNVTAYHNAVTLQVTNTKGSYDLNFQPIASWRNSILRALHYGVLSLLREPQTLWM
jgi:hypothetical protein